MSKPIMCQICKLETAHETEWVNIADRIIPIVWQCDRCGNRSGTMKDVDFNSDESYRLQLIKEIRFSLDD